MAQTKGLTRCLQDMEVVFSNNSTKYAKTNGLQSGSNGVNGHHNGQTKDTNCVNGHQNGQTKETNGVNGHKNGTSNGISRIGMNPINEGELLKKLFDLVLENKLATGDNINDKVVEFKHPKELKSMFDFEITDEGMSGGADVDDLLKKIIKYSVRTRHPNFYNQLYGGVDEVGLTGAWLTEALNTNQYTFEVAPVFVLIEHYVINWLINLFGWNDGDGIFNPGGSMSNIYAMNLARYQKYPDIKKTGLFNRKPLVVLTSDQSHYSMKKSACLMGLGLDQVVPVSTDDYGRMDPEALVEAIQKVRDEGREPYFVNATAGTTVFGAFDRLGDISRVCNKEGLWLHVDACWGGGVVMSKKHIHLLEGIENVDSISWNPHKMTCAPLQCSAFLVKHKGLLHEANCSGANYLFQQDKFYDISYDTGDKSVQCGRKPDAVKFWLMFKMHGNNYIEDQVNKSFEAARHLESEVNAREGFRPVLSKYECTNVCFWYIPPSLRRLPETDEWWQKVAKVAPIIKKRITLDGTLMVGYQPMTCKGHVNFFRMVVTTTPTPTLAHMDFVLDEIDRKGKDL